MHRSCFRSLLVITSALAVPVVSHADPAADAQVHVAAATTAHDRGDFRTAVVELQAAYALDPIPDLLYATGQVYVELGQCAEALPFYQRYLATSPPKQATADTRAAITACEHHDPLATGEPTTGPGVGTTSTATSTQTSTTAPTTAPAPPGAPGSAARTWYQDPIGDALVGAGVVVGAVGLVVYLGARSDLDRAEQAPDLAEYNQLVDHASSRRSLSVVLVSGGVLLVGAGVARWVLHSRGSETSTARVGVVPSRHGGLFTVGGSF